MGAKNIPGENQYLYGPPAEQGRTDNILEIISRHLLNELRVEGIDLMGFSPIGSPSFRFDGSR